MVTVPVLIISGSLGSGKTTVLGEASDLLIERQVRHAAIDLDGLAIAWPPVHDAPYNHWIMLQNLSSVWANYAREGVDRLLSASVVESREELAGYERAIPGAQIQVARLVASPETMLARLRIREPGAIQATMLARAPVLAELLEREAPDDFVVNNEDREVGAVAQELLVKAGWI
jgi:hypothetical protein